MGIKVSEVLIRTKEILNQPGVWIRWREYDKGRLPATDPGSWEQSDITITPSSVYYDGSQQGQHCLMGAVRRAKHELGDSKYDLGVSNLLTRLAPQVAIKHGKPLDQGKRLQYQRRRKHPAAWFNNTAESLDEVNDLLCEGIKEAVEQEESNASE